MKLLQQMDTSFQISECIHHCVKRRNITIEHIQKSFSTMASFKLILSAVFRNSSPRSLSGNRATFLIVCRPTHFPYRIVNPIRRFRRFFQTGLLFVLGQLFRKRLYDLRRHIDPSQSFQRLDHQARHVRQTGDFLVGPMLKFQLCGVPLIGLIRAVADIGPDRRYLCGEPQKVQGCIPTRDDGPMVTSRQCFCNCVRVSRYVFIKQLAVFWLLINSL